MATYSYSKIDAFKTCPKKYEFAYVRKLPRTARGIEAFLGSRVHEALEALYDNVLMCRVPDASEVLDRFRQGWEREWDPCIRIVRQDYTPADYKAAGERAVRLYYERHHPFDTGITVGLEQRVSLGLDSQTTLTGYVDRLVKVTDESWEIHDYKTSRRLPSQADVDSDRQLALYELALRETHPHVRDFTLVWHYLFQDQELRSVRTPEQLESLKEEVIADIAMIEASQEFPTCTSALCDWCDYREVCPAWTDELRVSELSEHQRLEDPDVQLVDRYAQVSSEIRSLEDEKSTLRSEIITRLVERGIESMAGTEDRVAYTSSPCIRLPKKGSAERSELENLLKENHLIDRCTTLDASSLAEVMDEGLIPEELAPAIERCLTYDERQTLRVARRREAR